MAYALMQAYMTHTHTHTHTHTTVHAQQVYTQDRHKARTVIHIIDKEIHNAASTCNLHKGMLLNFCPYPPIQWRMPLCKLTCACCIMHANGGGVVFDPLSLALVVLVFHHCAHVLLGTCGGLKGAGAGPSPQ